MRSNEGPESSDITRCGLALRSRAPLPCVGGQGGAPNTRVHAAMSGSARQGALAALIALLCLFSTAAAQQASRAVAEAALHQVRRRLVLLLGRVTGMRDSSCPCGWRAQVEADPLATKDSFAGLPAQLQRVWASSAAHHTLSDLLAGA